MLCHRLYLNEEENIEKLVQRLLFGIGILSLGITFTGCHASHSQTDLQKLFPDRQNRRPPTETETSSTLSLIDASGMTLESRIHTSDGYTRTKEADGSLAEFLRNYAMEPDQSPVLLYDGSKNAIKRLMLPYLISHLNMRISSNARIPPSGYMQNIFGVQSNTIALLFILRMDLTPSIRSGQTVTVSV